MLNPKKGGNGHHETGDRGRGRRIAQPGRHVQQDGHADGLVQSRMIAPLTVGMEVLKEKGDQEEASIGERGSGLIGSKNALAIIRKNAYLP